jgi:tryptophanyl-tRNA synthetase
MSKSDPSEFSRINLSDDAEAIAQKVRKAKTDPEPLPSDIEGLAGRPEAENLIGIYAALNDSPRENVLREFGGAQFSNFKNALVDLAVAKLGPIGAEMRRLEDDPAYIDSVLRDGSQRARDLARPVMDQVKDVLGLIH